MQFEIPNFTKKSFVSVNNYLKWSTIAPWVLFLGLSIYYGYRLLEFPIFADEAIYLHWTKRIFLGEENAFISVYDGKPPLFIWLSGIIYIITKQLLLSGRLVSVFIVLGTAGFVFSRLRRTSITQAWITTLLIGTSPFIYFHSRLAIMDSLLANLLLISILIFSTSSTLAQYLVSGTAWGLAILTKIPALFLFPIYPLIWLIHQGYKQPILPVILFGMPIAAVGLLLKSTIWFPSLFSRTQDFSYPIGDILNGQWQHILPNIITFFSWFIGYHSRIILVLSLIGIVLSVLKKQSLMIWITLSALIYAMPLFMVGKVISPRYYYYSYVCLILLAGYAISQFPRYVKISLTGVIIVYFGYLNYYNTLELWHSKLPEVDSAQYLKEWSSGIGLRESVTYLKEQSHNHPIKILTEGYFGTLPDGLFVLADPILASDQIEIVGVGSPESDNFYTEVAKAKTKQQEIYYIGNSNRISDITKERLSLIFSFPKPTDGPPLELYKVPDDLQPPGK